MDAEPTDLLAQFPIILTIPVQWGDQDAFLHVNNTVYLRWFESARIASPVYSTPFAWRSFFAATQYGHQLVV